MICGKVALLFDKHMVTNLAPVGTSANWSTPNQTFTQEITNGSDSWSATYPGIQSKTKSDKVEGYFYCEQKVHLIKGHKYYIRACVNISTSSYASITYDCYWPEAEPPAFSLIASTKNGGWQKISGVSTRSDWATGDYGLRFDVNNQKKAFTAKFSCPMVIDLTATYAGSTIPSKSTLDKMEYFSGTIPLSHWKQHVS